MDYKVACIVGLHDIIVIEHHAHVSFTASGKMACSYLIEMFKIRHISTICITAIATGS